MTNNFQIYISFFPYKIRITVKTKKANLAINSIVFCLKTSILHTQIFRKFSNAEQHLT